MTEKQGARNEQGEEKGRSSYPSGPSHQPPPCPGPESSPLYPHLNLSVPYFTPMPFPTSLLTFSPRQFLSNLAFYLAFSVILSPPLAPSFSPFPLSASTIPHGLHPYRQAP